MIPFSIHPYLLKQNPVSLGKWINISVGRRSFCPAHHFYTSSHLKTPSFTSMMPEFVKFVEDVKKNESPLPEKHSNLISQTNQLTVPGQLTVNH